MKVLVWAVVFFSMFGFAFAATEPLYIDTDFVLFWANPTRAYPGIPLDFRFVVYEKDNQGLLWQLLNAPAGMAIDQSGEIAWTPSDAQIGSYTITVRVTRQAGDHIERTFTLVVGTDDYIFVATDGSDSNDGSLSAPFATIERAMRSISSGNGKTILIRGGTYHEHYAWEANGVVSPLRGKNFSQADPVEIRSYPGEWAVLDCDLQGHGLWIYATNYVLVDNIEVQNANKGERAGIEASGSHIIVRDTKVHDSHWLSANNVTGYKIQATTDVVLDTNEGYDNFDSNNSAFWNSSNYLVYLDGSAIGDFYILNSKSRGSSSGFKIKHAGNAKLILHNNSSINDRYSYAVGSDLSSVRYSLSVNSNSGVVAGIADPNIYNKGKVLIENNTIVNASAAGITFYGGYFTTAASIIRDNIIFNTIGAAGTGEGDRRLLGFWYYDANASTYPIDSNYNLLYSPSQGNIVRRGNANFNYSFSSWKDVGQDVDSIFADPLFVDAASGDFRLQANSPACGVASDGGNIGALPCLFGSDTISPGAPSGLSVH